ncbi:glutamate mutase L, partial [Candidatus Bathyarchaeota archaeon]|nr:glutamate mutase L [Candidatus Bathyarchaeota archaeon]
MPERPTTGFENINTILATDCGSTTSKARFFRKIGDEYRFVVAGEAPTTVEAPYEDVTAGVRNAVREVEELTGLKLLSSEGIITPSRGGNEGVDLYVTTSSAGGGLQMMVFGVAKVLTAESSERAALGAGAIVMDVMAVDDGRRIHEKIQRMRFLRPDMILFAGGTDGGTIIHVAGIAELINSANPKPRLGLSFILPLVYAGNAQARGRVKEIFGDNFALKVVDNIRPTLDVEHVEPARAAVHELFMEHVMSHAPGYDKLMKWTTVPIMPTPAGEGMMFQAIAAEYNANVIGVGLGGATTNVYSIYDGVFVRTVSANLGMSYSICNVLKETGIENVLRWLPFDIDKTELKNRLINKMIRPTTIPQTLDELMIEHAVAREALRLGFNHHKRLTVPLRGVGRGPDMEKRFSVDREESGTYIKMMKINWLGGTGGLLSHAPLRSQSALILIDGFLPEGVTKLAVDSVFMMPHLGVLSTVNRKAAVQIFEKDCLVKLGTCIALKGSLKKDV